MLIRVRLLLAAVAVAAAGCGSNSGPQGPPPAVGASAKNDNDSANAEAPGFFTDVTAQAGIQHVYQNGDEAGHYGILESLGGGVGVLDYNQDGLLDLFFPGGGSYTPDKKVLGLSGKLFKNEGNWKFTDVTAAAGLDKADFYSHGAIVGDYNNDGWPDLLVTGYGRLALFRNQQGKFEEVTEAAGLLPKQDVHWSTSAGFADFNGDGHPDLFIAHYVNWHVIKNNPECHDATGRARDVCSPKQYEGLPHYLYLSDGKGKFRDVSNECVVENTPDGKVIHKPLRTGKGLGVLVLDVNHDRLPDIYVANDTTDNYLYINKGDAKFEEQATQLGVARDENNVPNGSMGVAGADYDGSGHFSVFVTNYQHEAHQLYRNKGQGPFHFASTRAGIMAIGLIYVGWGTAFIDFDRDGAEDIFITNGHVVRQPPPPGTLKQRPVLLKNMRQPGDQPFAVRFKDVTKEGGPFFWKQHMGRGMAVADLDNDGRPDLVVAHMKDSVALLRNDVKNDNRWLGVLLAGQSNRDIVGTEVILELEVDVKGQKQPQKLHRQVMAGGSWASSSDRRIVFGLNTEHKPIVKSLTVKWPSGKTQLFPVEVLKLDRYLKITEGDPTPRAPIGKEPG